MTKNLTVSALVLALAAPAFAATQAELSVGADSGEYTLSQIADIAGAEEAHDAARLKAFYASDEAGVSRADFSANATPVTERGNQSSDR